MWTEQDGYGDVLGWFTQPHTGLPARHHNKSSSSHKFMFMGLYFSSKVCARRYGNQTTLFCMCGNVWGNYNCEICKQMFHSPLHSLVESRKACRLLIWSSHYNVRITMSTPIIHFETARCSYIMHCHAASRSYAPNESMLVVHSTVGDKHKESTAPEADTAAKKHRKIL